MVFQHDMSDGPWIYGRCDGFFVAMWPELVGNAHANWRVQSIEILSANWKPFRWFLCRRWSYNSKKDPQMRNREDAVWCLVVNGLPEPPRRSCNSANRHITNIRFESCHMSMFSCRKEKLREVFPIDITTKMWTKSTPTTFWSFLVSAS